jgi:transcriptional regulator with XRE-family HTH domain
MEASVLIRTARHRAGLTIRDMAALSGTSHSAIAAYESGSKEPRVSTLDRVVRAAGCAIEPTLGRRVDLGSDRGSELAAVLDLAAQFPARHSPRMACPPFPRGRS